MRREEGCVEIFQVLCWLKYFIIMQRAVPVKCVRICLLSPLHTYHLSSSNKLINSQIETS